MKKRCAPYNKAFVFIIFAILSVSGCQSMKPGQKSQQDTTNESGYPNPQPDADISEWYGTYIKEDRTFILTISEDAFIHAKQMENGKYRPFNRISPYAVESLSKTKLLVSGPDLNSATQAAATYVIAKDGDRYSLERRGNNMFQGFLGWYNKEETTME